MLGSCGWGSVSEFFIFCRRLPGMLTSLLPMLSLFQLFKLFFQPLRQQRVVRHATCFAALFVEAITADTLTSCSLIRGSNVYVGVGGVGDQCIIMIEDNQRCSHIIWQCFWLNYILESMER